MGTDLPAVVSPEFFTEGIKYQIRTTEGKRIVGYFSNWFFAVDAKEKRRIMVVITTKPRKGAKLETLFCDTVYKIRGAAQDATLSKCGVFDS